MEVGVSTWPQRIEDMKAMFAPYTTPRQARVMRAQMFGDAPAARVLAFTHTRVSRPTTTFTTANKSETSHRSAGRSLPRSPSVRLLYLSTTPLFRHRQSINDGCCCQDARSFNSLVRGLSTLVASSVGDRNARQTSPGRPKTPIQVSREKVVSSTVFVGLLYSTQNHLLLIYRICQIEYDLPSLVVGTDRRCMFSC